MSKFIELALELEAIDKQRSKHWAVQSLSGSQESHCEGVKIEISLIQSMGARHLVLDGDACNRLSLDLVKLIEREIEWQKNRKVDIETAMQAANSLLEKMDGSK